MKKFLTVLLVIAVMFTFSFSSAFATVADANKKASSEMIQDVIDAAQAAKDAELQKMNAQIYALFGSKTEETAKIGLINVTLSKDAVTAAFQEKYDETAAAIDVAMNAKLADIQAKIIADNGTGEPFSGYFDASGVGEDGYPAVVSTWTVFGGSEYTAVTYSDEIKISTGVWTGVQETLDKALEEQLSADKASLLAVIEAAEKTLETTYSKDAKGAPQSNYDKAKEDVTNALNRVSTLLVTNDSNNNSGAFATAFKTLAELYVAPVNQADPQGALYQGGTVSGSAYTYNGLAKLPKLSSEPTEAAKLDWAKNFVLTKLNSEINTWETGVITTQTNIITAQKLLAKPNATTIANAEEAIETVKAQAAAAREVLAYLVADSEAWTDLIAFEKYSTTSSSWAASTDFDTTATVVKAASPADGEMFVAPTAKWAFASGTLKVPAKDFAPSGTNYATVTAGASSYTNTVLVAMAKKVVTLKSDAELAKQTVELDGTTYAEIEKALEKAIDETYYGRSDAAVKKASAGALLDARKAELIGADGETVKVNNKTYNTVKAWDDVLTSSYSVYNKDQYDVVRAVVADTKDAIKAAGTIADAESAFLAGLDKLDAVPTKADQALAQSKKEFVDLKAKYTTDITNYLTYKDAGFPAKTYDYNKSLFLNDATNKDGLLNSLDTVYTVEELTAAYKAAIAEIDNLKTEAELKTIKADLEKRLAALPTSVTVADAATVEALRGDVDAHNKYCDMIGNTTEKVVVVTALTNAETAIKAAEEKAIKDAYNAIMKDGKATADEAAAVAELRTAFDAYCKKYTPENAHNGNLVTQISDASVTETLVSAREGEVYGAQADLVKEMIAKLAVDNIDAAAVKAAREAYDALDDDYKFGGEYYDKLVALEKMVTENAKAYVQDLGIKARSTKTAKGVKITIKADVQQLLDAGFTVEYKFYRSTKSNAKFGSPKITKTTNTYLNTSGKKGTRYYYKARLVVKNAKGEVVAITPLSQCLYATRVF